MNGEYKKCATKTCSIEIWKKKLMKKIMKSIENSSANSDSEYKTC